MLRNREDALDVVHGMFVDVMQKRPTSLALPYLYRAVTHRCLNVVRDRANRQRLLDKQQTALVPVARTRCDDRVIGLDMLAKLAERLDDRAMEVLVCRFVDDMTQDEIAVMLGTSRKTVGKRLAKIRAAVQELTP